MANGDLYLSDSPNVDKGFVEQQDGTLQRAVLQATPSGNLQLSDSTNVDSGYITDTDGKKHKVNLVAEVDGSLELPNNPASDQGYVVDNDGKKHRVQLVASLYGSGGSATIDELNVTPSTSAQTITATGGVDGYSPVNVSAVTSSIDANIVAGNIKKDVTILGVTGSFEGGVTPTGTLPITSNGVYDVTNYASADVQVPTTAPAHYIEKSVNANGTLIGASTIINMTGVTSVGEKALYYAYYGNTSITGAVNFSDITNLADQDSLSYTFTNCTGITSVDLGSLTTIASPATGCLKYAFSGCTGITSVDLGSLNSIQASSAFESAFNSCTNLPSINLGSLKEISGQYAFSSAFSNCTSLTTADLSLLVTLESTSSCAHLFRSCPSLTTVLLSSLTVLSGNRALEGAFSYCTALSTLSFPALSGSNLGSYTNQFNNMLQGVTGCTVHFPSNLQSVIGSWSSVTAGFGGTNTTVLYDLPATVRLTGSNATTYVRNPKYDTATALAWRPGQYYAYNMTPYYTSGTTDPVVGDTIYSDAACTQVVTTISSIA